MKRLVCLYFIFFSSNIVIAQTIRIAILDFDNISGIAKYDGLGKAMSSMLISDIESNVSSETLQLVERAQVQKILKEQNFQASGNVNKNTAVQTGKILGVNYLLVGDVYILNDQLIINARLTNTETGDIVFSKKQEGKLVNWLTLKSNIAGEISTKLKIPINTLTLNSDITNEKSILLYAEGINYIDKNELDSANIILTELKYSDKSFNYSDNELEKLFDKVTSQSSNNTLKQKAYILNLHKKISTKPSEAWQQIETFWNGPLDEKYPYLEYVFLKNVYERFKEDSIWLDFQISRHGVNAKMGDMILFSISNHANLAGELNASITYNQIREKFYPTSEIAIIWGEPIDVSKYRWALIDDPNSDTLYYKYLILSQEAYIMGLGSRNFEVMRDYLTQLIEITEFPFYDYIPSEYYYELGEKKLPIFNPYDVLGTLVILVGNEKEIEKCKNFFIKNKEKKIYTGLLQEMPWFNNQVENGMLIKNATTWAQSNFDDYKNKNWTDFNFDDNSTALLCFITIKAICLQTLNMHAESYEVLEELHLAAEKYPSINNEVLWVGLNMQEIYFIVQLRNCVKLGKSDDVKFISKQLNLLGIDPDSYLMLHTELTD
jgi:TolB-like protein